MEHMDKPLDVIADEALEPSPDAPPASKYALNSTPGVLHIVARRRKWSRAIPGRTNCGTDFRTPHVSQVNSLSATYVRCGVELHNTKCNSCAKPEIWAELATALDDASASDA